jgi:pimeloyl-ACP methyl ester carboxylesterase
VAGRAPAVASVRGEGGVRLSCLDYGGGGPPVLLLHGLCGEAREWEGTATRLRPRFRVLALDQRGHGSSDRAPGRYGRDAYVADAAAAIVQLGLAPAAVVGHSMGGLNAYLLAARYPDLVHALVVVEAQASANPDGMAALRTWLRTFPVPFRTAEAARAFMQVSGFPGEAWRELLDERPDGWWPRFDVDGAIRSTVDLGERGYWEEWRTIRCPTLVVGGSDSELAQAELEAMAACLPHGCYTVVDGAGHTVHLDRVDVWDALLAAFLAEHHLAGSRPDGA